MGNCFNFFLGVIIFDSLPSPIYNTNIYKPPMIIIIINPVIL